MQEAESMNKLSPPRTAPRRTNASHIAAARIRAGMTQAQLAEAIGSTQKEVSLWETGSRCPRATTLLKIARALNCPAEALMPEE